jgi:hypothetical protein
MSDQITRLMLERLQRCCDPQAHIVDGVIVTVCQHFRTRPEQQNKETQS